MNDLGAHVAGHGGEPTAVDMIACDDCGTMVPAMNMTIHRARACQGRARGQDNNHIEAEYVGSTPSTPIPMEFDDDGNENGDDDELRQFIPAPAISNQQHQQSRQDVIAPSNVETIEIGDSPSPRRNRVILAPDSYATPPPPFQNGLHRRGKEDRDARIQREETTSAGISTNNQTSVDVDDGDIIEVGDVIDLVDSPAPPAAAVAASAARQQQQQQNDDPDSDEVVEQWACPKCTLLNPVTRGTCDACLYRNPSFSRSANRARAERFVNFGPRAGAGTNNTNPTNVSPLSFVSGGALLGGMLGAAGSFIQGRDLFSGAAEGAFTGGVGGAFLGEIMRPSTAGTTNNAGNNQVNDVAQARSSNAMGIAGYPSINQDDAGRTSRNVRPRSSFRVVQQRDANGSTTTILTNGNAATRITRRNLGGGTMPADDPMISMLLHSLLLQQNGTADGMDTDGMGYEELLRAFGDGTDNLGAEEGQIRQLPVKELKDPEKELPEDARQCLICLEDFQPGEKRMILPCLHGFHQQCADKWLRSNAACPICKHRLPS